MKPGQGALRAGRVFAFAVSAVALGSAAHVAAGGAVPLAAVVVTLPLVMIAINALAARQRGFVTLAAAMAGVQTMLHIAFMVFERPTTCGRVPGAGGVVGAANAVLSGGSAGRVPGAGVMTGVLSSAAAGRVPGAGVMTGVLSSAAAGRVPGAGGMTAVGRVPGVGGMAGAGWGVGHGHGVVLCGGMGGGMTVSAGMLLAHVVAAGLLVLLLARGEAAVWALAAWVRFRVRRFLAGPVLVGAGSAPSPIRVCDLPVVLALPRTRFTRRGPPVLAGT